MGLIQNAIKTDLMKREAYNLLKIEIQNRGRKSVNDGGQASMDLLNDLIFYVEKTQKEIDSFIKLNQELEDE